MSETATPRSKRVLIALLALAVAAVAAFAAWRLTSGDDDNGAEGPGTTSTSSAPTEEPTEEPTPTETPSCEGPDTSLDRRARRRACCPTAESQPSRPQQQQKSGLGLGCGGTYPVILYKTTTSAAKTSICGKDASGESFRMVTQGRGGPVLDLPASYDPQRDAFVAKKDGTSYAVLAYNGSLVVTQNGQSATQTSDNDWISLDNEDDYD